MTTPERPAVLDACVVLNLWASRHFDDVLAASGIRPIVSGRAAREALWTLDDNGERERVPCAELAAAGRIEIWNAVDDELNRMLELATKLGDGEAESLAIAQSRDLPVATDDRPARTAARHLAPPVALMSTSELLRVWAGTQQPVVVAGALQRVESGATFRPPRVDPNEPWWSAAIQGPPHDHPATI